MNHYLDAATYDRLIDNLFDAVRIACTTTEDLRSLMAQALALADVLPADDVVETQSIRVA